MDHRHAIIAMLAGLAALSATDRDPSDIIEQVRAKIVATGKRMPNYTCIETVNRRFFRPAAVSFPKRCDVLLQQRNNPTPDMVLKLSTSDRLRLDVSMTAKGEIFSCVGAKRFEDEGIHRVVSSGPMGTGAFGAFLGAVFGGDAKKFDFTGKSGDLLEYRFDVPFKESHYKIKLGEGWYYTSYSGTVQVNPESLDIVRMKVETSDLPDATHECMALSTLEFGTMEIGGKRFPLATQATQRFVLTDGEESENSTSFSNCHEYVGESAIRFEEAPSEAGTSPATRKSTPLRRIPSYLKFSMELSEPIDTSKAAAGDPVSGRLLRVLRDDRGKQVARAGAKIEGHLLRVQQIYEDPAGMRVSFRLESVEVDGTRVSLAAMRDFAAEVAAARAKHQKLNIPMPFPEEGNAGVFAFPPDHVIPRGFRSDWRTVAVE